MTSTSAPASRFFHRQLATYATYHRNTRNRLTHFAGIPIIIFSLMLVLARASFEVGGVAVSWAIAVSAAAFVLWIALDVGVGALLSAALLPVLGLAEWLAEWLAGTADASTVWWVFAIAFVGGWALQFLGHAFEGRRPALVDNLFQALVGPMFLVAELLAMTGRRPDLAETLDAAYRRG